MRVLVCGGRDFTDADLVCATLDRLHLGPRGPVTALIHGGAKGADALGAAWALLNDDHPRVIEFKADWSTHGKAAGPIRNKRMLDEGRPHLVVAFKGGRGTADLVRQADKAGIAVMEVRA